MLTPRLSTARGHANLGWLDSYHTFSFGRYHDPKHMGFRGLRVINEDRVAPGMGFSPHEHDNMEIISYVLAGTLRHRDSLGHQADLTPGEVQRISAGTGIQHSEFNPSKAEPVHFLQIWLEPAFEGAKPAYDQRRFDVAKRPGTFVLVASGDGTPEGAGPASLDAAIRINVNAKLYAGVFEVGQTATVEIGADRHAWVQVVRGSAQVNGLALNAGDAVAASQEPRLVMRATAICEILVFDLA
jgi:quercetin 2,3-dioxygenase